MTVTSPVGATSPSGLCADYRRAAAEIDIALSRNGNVARTFTMAAAHSESQAAEGGGRDNRNLPTWVVEVAAAQTGELAAEIEEFSDELAVARDEIDQAAQAQGCW